MALGEGRREALFVIPAGLLGAASWTVLYQTGAGQWLVNQANYGSILITGKPSKPVNRSLYCSRRFLMLSCYSELRFLST